MRNLENVWCCTGVSDEGLALLNIVKTDPEPI
jgi:hypothetical protein